MNLLDSRNRIQKLMSLFVTQVKGATAMGQTDINRISETVLIPLFAEVYGYKHLRNLNDTEHINFPGIDLGDDIARVAFQITSTADSDKVKDTLHKFVQYKLYERYDKLIIYVLTERQKTYSSGAYATIIQGRFSFAVDDDIWDYRNFLRKAGALQLDKTILVQNILEANFGEGKADLFAGVADEFTEMVWLNLLELFFPQTLYIADLVPDRKRAARESSGQRSKYSRSSPRTTVQKALEQRGLRFSVDWEYFEGRVITFHDLSDENLPLAQVVDQGTVTPIDPEEFYGIDDNYEKVFKTLLGRCLQQKLYQQRVLWQHNDKLYIFADVDGEASRVERWSGKRESDRVVYERTMKNNKPNEILHCKHLAFRTQYKRFGTQWFLLIKPEWFFSRDGYRRTYYGSEKIEWLKRHEGNSQVFNHLRFIAYFLAHDKPPELFIQIARYPFLSFGQLLSFDSSLSLDDEDWNPPRAEEAADTGQLEMFDL